MADPTFDRERIEREREFRAGGSGRTERFEVETVRGNPDLPPEGGVEARDRSIGVLLKELRDESVTLVQQEIALTKSELAEKARAIGVLAKDLRDESMTLVKQEIALAKTEMSEKARVAARNAAKIAVGGAVAFAGALILLMLATIVVYMILVAVGLHETLSGLLSFLLVGGITALIGYGMIKKGMDALKHESMVPEQTVESLKEDKQWLTNQTK